jgi:hypothetical protein
MVERGVESGEETPNDELQIRDDHPEVAEGQQRLRLWGETRQREPATDLPRKEDSRCNCLDGLQSERPDISLQQKVASLRTEVSKTSAAMPHLLALLIRGASREDGLDASACKKPCVWVFGNNTGAEREREREWGGEQRGAGQSVKHSLKDSEEFGQEPISDGVERRRRGGVDRQQEERDGSELLLLGDWFDRKLFAEVDDSNDGSVVQSRGRGLTRKAWPGERRWANLCAMQRKEKRGGQQVIGHLCVSGPGTGELRVKYSER